MRALIIKIYIDEPFFNKKVPEGNQNICPDPKRVAKAARLFVKRIKKGAWNISLNTPDTTVLGTMMMGELSSEETAKHKSNNGR